MQCSTAGRFTVVMWCFCFNLSSQCVSPTIPSRHAQSRSSTARKEQSPKPAMRTYVLWQVSHGYRKVQPAKADTVLQAAFTASLVNEDEVQSEDCHMQLVCDVQAWLQREILQEMLRSAGNKPSPESVEKLLPQANPEVRKQMLEGLAREYVEKRNFDRARQFMGQMDEDRYSYFLVGELMDAIPASRREERLGVFAQSLVNFQNRNLDSLGPDNYDDFGILVLRFWRQLPQSLVLGAVDTILERSKDRDESRKAHSVAMTLTNGGSLAFGSEYEFRLFQLLPILKELDQSKAERLLGEHNEARLALDRYPGGMQSLDPNYYGDHAPDEKAMPGVMEITPAVVDDPVKNGEYQSMIQLEAQIDAQIHRVVEEAGKDPEKAYQDAMNLPLRRARDKAGCPRASGLSSVALRLAQDYPTLARTAMNEARRLAQDLDPFRQALLLAEIPDFYLKLGDEDGARSAIKDQLKLAEKLYLIDTDASDPNLAFKGAWPSANAWRNSIQQATKVSPAFAEEILEQIPDPDITGLQRVIYANSLLGAGKSSIAVVEWHKGGRRGGIFMSQ